jgi:hypothetical protein
MAGLDQMGTAQAAMTKASAAPTLASGYRAFRLSSNVEDLRGYSTIAPRPAISPVDILTNAMPANPELNPSARLLGRGVGPLAMDAGYYSILK